jgi:hypothetical protein
MQPHKTPNFNLPRVQEKCRNLLLLADEIDLYGPRQICERTVLAPLLGSGAHPLGAYLRNGLIRFGSYSRESKRAFSYRLNEPFIAQLRARLSIYPPPAIETAKRVDRMFSHSVRGECKRTGHRVYPWWSYMKREKVEELFLGQFGVMYRYDMQVSQPNIVLQLFDKVARSDTPGIRLVNEVPTWRALVADRTHFRSTLADSIGCTLPEMKDIVQSITNGGYATSSPRNPICKTLGLVRTMKLIDHPYYLGLVKDYRRIRTVLFPRTKVKDLKGRLYRTYEKIEDAVMMVVDAHLTQLGVDGWFIHDCVITHQKLRTKDLTTQVRDKTGFTVTFEEDITHSSPPGPPLYDLPKSVDAEVQPFFATLEEFT